MNSPMFSIFLAALITASIFYTSILYKSSSLVILAYACALYFVLACVFLAYRVRTVSCRITFPVSIAECGRPLTACIEITNTGFLPCLKFRCLLVQRNRFINKKQKKWLCGGMAAGAGSSFDYSAVIDNYGSYDMELKKLRIYDLTGLFYLDKRVKSICSVQVLPNMQEIGVHLTEAVRNFPGEADVYDEYRPGDDPSELFQVRPFQNGDRIQRIHWKLSAKSEELLVKEDSLPKACPVVFLLGYKNEKQKTQEKVNAYLSVLSSISFSLMDAGCPHYAAWYSSRQGDIVRVRVDDEESLYLFLSCYLEESFERQEGSLLEAYREKYRGENYLYALQLDESLELLKNQTKIEGFRVKSWRERLSRLELIL